ncbi:hypothetical protein ACGFJC_06740 [Nonomuraea fuscirosea]|uniref:hypothetical protein n=1 Tax=Nonomuraea fuscirosea TaxID=1291556 RepID=UPI00347CC5D9
MRYLDEYRDPVLARRLVTEIRTTATRRWPIMEVCGGQTHTIVRQGIDELIPVRMVHGPGCPVCVTPLGTIDRALAIAARPEVVFTSFGDMMRVPGSGSDLLSAKARGADVRVVYSPLDTVRLAKTTPGRQVVFFATCPRRGRWRRPARSRLAGGDGRAPARRLDAAGRSAADRNSVKRITPSRTTGPRRCTHARAASRSADRASPGERRS